MEVLLTFFEQLVLPFGVLLPIRSLRIGAYDFVANDYPPLHPKPFVSNNPQEDKAVPLVLVGLLRPELV